MSMDAPAGMEVFKYDGNGMPVFRKIRKPKGKPKLPPHPLAGLPTRRSGTSFIGWIDEV